MSTASIFLTHETVIVYKSFGSIHYGILHCVSIIGHEHFSHINRYCFFWVLTFNEDIVSYFSLFKSLYFMKSYHYRILCVLKNCIGREIEKLKLSELTCPQGIIEVAKMWVASFYFKIFIILHIISLWWLHNCRFLIYLLSFPRKLKEWYVILGILVCFCILYTIARRSFLLNSVPWNVSLGF